MSRTSAAIGISITFYLLSTLLLVIRLFSEWKRARATWTAFISLLFCALSWVFLTVAYSCGFVLILMNPKPDIYDEKLPLILKSGWTVALTTITSTWCVKGSFIAMFFQLSPHISKNLRTMLWIIVVVLIAAYLTSIISFMSWCRKPISEILNVHQFPPDYCNPTAFSGDASHLVLGSVLNISTDVVIMGAPLLILRTLKLGSRETLAVAFLVFLGCSTITIITVRTVITASIPAGVTKVPIILNNAELCTQFVAVCLPALRAKIRSASEAILGSMEERSRSKGERSAAPGGGGGYKLQDIGRDGAQPEPMGILELEAGRLDTVNSMESLQRENEAKLWSDRRDFRPVRARA